MQNEQMLNDKFIISTKHIMTTTRTIGECS